MPTANGATITRAELAELEKLIESENPYKLAWSRLHPSGEEYRFDAEAALRYRGLHDAGLIDGAEVDAGFLFRSLNTRGYDFVADLAEEKREARARIWSDRSFQLGLSVLTLLLSTVAGWIAGHI